MDTQAQRAPLMTGVSFLLLAAAGMPLLVFFAIGLLGPDLMVDLFLDPIRLGGIAGLSFGMAALLSPWAVGWVRAMGNRASLVTLFFLVGVSLSLIAAMPGMLGLILAALCGGTALALSTPVAYQCIAEEVPPQRATLVLSFQQAGLAAAALFAGLTLPGLAFEWGWRSALAIWAPVALLMAIQVFTWLPARQDEGRTMRGHRVRLPNRRLGLLMIMQACSGFVLAAFITFFGVYTNQLDIDADSSGLMLAAFGLAGILSGWLFNRAARSLEDESIIIGMLFSMAGLALALMRLADPESLWLLWLAAIAMGLTLCPTQAIAMNMLIRDPRFGGASAVRGLLSLAWLGGAALGPLCFAWLLTHTERFDSAWLTLVAVLLFGCLLGIRLMHVRKPGLVTVEE
ncbi:MAG: MFS transporter [Lautropia sp.]|nr:MFS transporter [Lautropia sp.]